MAVQQSQQQQQQPKQYKIRRMTKIIRSDGSILRPVGDKYIPSTEEEIKLCEYFKSLGLLE